MTKFIRWVEDEGYTPSGKKLYVLDYEDNLDSPRWWTPTVIGSDGYLRNVPSEYLDDDWSTKSKAKQACERHYIATYTKDVE